MISQKDVMKLPLNLLLARIKFEEKTLEILKRIYELRSRLEKDNLNKG